ncbi:TD and POZ domain-containing protein 1, partial [Caerostris darwini]
DGWVAGQDNVTKQEFTKKRYVYFRSFNLKYGRSDEFAQLLLTSIIPNGKLSVRCKMWKCSGEINNDGYCSARTHIGVEKKSSIWSIRNFSTLEKGNELTYRINSPLNDKSIVTLKFSVSGADETLQVSIISSDTEVESRTFSIKLSILDINGEAVTCRETEVLLEHLLEPVCLLTFTKKDIMRKKSQYFRDDVLSLLYECNFSTGLVYEEIENNNYGWIPLKTTIACLPDLKLTECTATTNPSAPTKLIRVHFKKDIELMMHEKILVLKSECAAWLARSFTIHQKWRG